MSSAQANNSTNDAAAGAGTAADSAHKRSSQEPAPAAAAAAGAVADSSAKASLPGRQSVPLIGLYNQALYMTAPFRAQVFRWRAEDGQAAALAPTPAASPEPDAPGGATVTPAATAPASSVTHAASGPSAGALKRSVPYQLQLLFARMLLSRSRGAVNTADLTHAFGWSNADNFRQHDVQELMRVLFGALEVAWGGGAAAGDASSPTRSPLAELYTGTLLDVVQCCTCGARRERSDPFQDLSLSVSGCPTLADSLRHFIAVERLDGNNALRCSSTACGDEKQPATKGLLLRSLPPIFTFQLKRFIFDFQLMQRIKVNDAFDFPQTIDMSEFVTAPPAATEGQADAPKPSMLYELFAILMHSGVAQGGHYYAYLKSLKDGRFYEFNDSHVWQLPDGLEGAMKAAKGGGGSNGGSSAYMLMYRRVEEEKNQPASDAPADAADDAAGVSPSSAPDDYESMLSADVRALIAAEERKHESEAAQAEVERRTLDIVVHYAPPADAPLQTVTFQLDLATEMQHFVRQLLSSFGIPDASLSDVRLRKYEPSLRWASTIYLHDVGLTLEIVGFSKRNVLLLEVKAPGQVWPPYAADTIPVRVTFVDPSNVSTLVEQSVHPQVTDDVFVVSVAKSAKLDDLRVAIVNAATAATNRAMPTIPAVANQRLLLLHESHAQLLKDESPATTLYDFDLFPGRFVYVEHALEPELLRPAFERLRCQIEICFNVPTHPALLAPAPADGSKPPPPAQPDYNRVVRVSRNDTLGSVKRQIGLALNLDPSSFRLSRTHTAPQFKDESATLGELQLVNQSGIFVSMGRPLQKDEVQCRFFLFQPECEEKEAAATTTEAAAATAAASSEAASSSSSAPPAAAAVASASSRFLHLFDLPIRSGCLISDLKKDVLGFLSKKRPHPTDPAANGWGIAHVRVRNKKNQASTKVMEDAKTLEENCPQLEDGTEIALQALPAPEVWRADQMMLQAQQWIPKTQKLMPPADCIIRKNLSVAGMRAQLWRSIHPEEAAALAVASAAAQVAPAAAAVATAAPSASSSASSTDSAASIAPPAAVAAASSACVPSVGSRIVLAKGKIVGRMKRADIPKLSWLREHAEDANKLARNALALRSGELMVWYEEASAEEKAEQKARDEDKKKKAAEAAAAAAASNGTAGASSAAPAAPPKSSVPLKPWQRGGPGRSVRKPGTGTGVAASVRAAPKEHALRIGLTAEQEAAYIAAEEEELAIQASLTPTHAAVTPETHNS